MVPQTEPSSSTCWSAVYGSGVTISNVGLSRARTVATSSACSSAVPNPTTTTAATCAKWNSAGTNGAGGALMHATPVLVVAPSDPRTSRVVRRACAARSCSTNNIARCTMGPTSCRRYSNSVTTPKLPPPPRSAQNRSGCSVALARTQRPSASTTCADSRLSIVSPCTRVSQPQPPPSVRPPTPVWLIVPAGTARPCSCVAASSCPNDAPPPTRARRACGSTTTWWIGLRSIISPPSGTAAPQ